MKLRLSDDKSLNQSLILLLLQLFSFLLSRICVRLFAYFQPNATNFNNSGCEELSDMETEQEGGLLFLP